MFNLIFSNNKEKLIPKHWYEITVGQYQQLVKLDIDDTTESMMEIISIFTELPIDTLESMEIGEFKKLSDLVSTALLDLKNRKQNRAKQFKYKSNKYKLISNFYKIKTNEFMLLESLIKKDIFNNIHRIIPILYKNSKLTLSDESAKELSCEIAFSALDFIIPHVRK